MVLKVRPVSTPTVPHWQTPGPAVLTPPPRKPAPMSPTQVFRKLLNGFPSHFCHLCKHSWHGKSQHWKTRQGKGWGAEPEMRWQRTEKLLEMPTIDIYFGLGLMTTSLHLPTTLFISSFYIWENGVSERLGDLPKVTQLVQGRAGIWTQIYLILTAKTCKYGQPFSRMKVVSYFWHNRQFLRGKCSFEILSYLKWSWDAQPCGRNGRAWACI